MTAEDVELAKQWRTRFGQPLPMLGCADIVRAILISEDSVAHAENPIQPRGSLFFRHPVSPDGGTATQRSADTAPAIAKD